MRTLFCLFMLGITASQAAAIRSSAPLAEHAASGDDIAGVFFGGESVHDFGGESVHDAASSATLLDLPPDASDDLAERLNRISLMDLDEVVWLARCMYSESDRAEEQELVAWVVRNRVETHYRGQTYREVVLETKQFSAFNQPSKRRNHILSLDENSPLRAWRGTLAIALDVYQAPRSERPFAQTVRHFYSPVSMVGGRTPAWARTGRALSSASLGIDRERFIFFDDVDERITHADGFPEPPSPGIARRVSDDSRVTPGFTIRLQRPSGKVTRPRRPTVQPAKSSKR